MQYFIKSRGAATLVGQVSIYFFPSLPLIFLDAEAIVVDIRPVAKLLERFTDLDTFIWRSEYKRIVECKD